MALIDSIHAAAATLGIDLTVDPDEIRLTQSRAAYAADGTARYSKLGAALSIAMLCNDDAQRRYREIYGCDWEPCPAESLPSIPLDLAAGTDPGRYADSTSFTVR